MSAASPHGNAGKAKTSSQSTVFGWMMACALLLTLPGTADAQVKRCSASLTPEGLAGGRFGTIKSDVDGYRGPNELQYYHSSDEDCKWEIQCPAGLKFFSYRLVANLGANANVTLRDPAGNIGYTVATSSAVQEVRSEGVIGLLGVDSGRVAVSFVTSSGSKQGLGFDLHFQCYASQCSSAQAAAPQTAASGSILTDTDGSGPAKYVPWERCQWRIECPLGSRGGITMSFRGNTGTTELEVTPEDQNGWKGIVGGETKLTYLKTNNVTLSLFAAEAAAGFTLDWQCLRSECTADQAALTQTAATGTLRSDFDGKGPQKYLMGERCQWRIECPANHGAITVRFSGDTGAEELELTPDGGQQEWRGPATAAMQRITFVARSLSVVFNPLSAGEAGFDLSWECRPSECHTPMTDGPISGYASRVQRGVWATSTESSRCQHVIQCPTGSNYLLTSGWVRLKDGATLQVGSKPALRGPGNFEVFDFASLADVRSAEVSFDSADFGTVSSNASVVFEVAYICHATRCLSLIPTVGVVPEYEEYRGLALPAGVSVADLSISGGNASWGGGSSCTWNLGEPCYPHRANTVWLKGEATLGTSADSWSVGYPYYYSSNGTRVLMWKEYASGRGPSVDTRFDGFASAWSTTKLTVNTSTLDFSKTWYANSSCVRECYNRIVKNGRNNGVTTNCYDPNREQYIEPPLHFASFAARVSSASAALLVTILVAVVLVV